MEVEPLSVLVSLVVAVWPVVDSGRLLVAVPALDLLPTGLDLWFLTRSVGPYQVYERARAVAGDARISPSNGMNGTSP